MSQNLIRFNVGTGQFDTLNLFTVKQGTNFTVPTSKTKPSLVDAAFGGAKLASSVDVVGGQLLVAINDGAVGANTFDLTMQNVCDLSPGDVIAISAVSSNAATLTVTSPEGSVRSFIITGITTVAAAIGYWA